MQKLIFAVVTLVAISSMLISEVSANVETYSNRYVELTLERYDDAVITIGVIENGEASYYVYTPDSQEESGDVYQYEIGSITKTFNGILTARAILDDKMSLDDTIDEHLDLEAESDFPTVEQLLTHTSGYARMYAAPRESGNRNNPFSGISRTELREQAERFVSTRGFYNYSNFGVALLGLVLEEVEEQPYQDLVESLFDEFDMVNSEVYSQTEILDIEENWVWRDDDAYIPVGAIISDVNDMLNYLQVNIDSTNEAVALSHTQLESLDITPQRMKDLVINFDALGYQWRIDEENDIYFHSGQTSDYGSYLAFNKDEEVGVIVMINTPPARDPSLPVLIGTLIMQDLLGIEVENGVVESD